jgi:hypothetical protein
MSKGVKRGRPVIPGNNTVKLPTVLRRRVEKAMAAEGFTVWSEFCRVALTEKCHDTEVRLRAEKPARLVRAQPAPESAR